MKGLVVLDNIPKNCTECSLAHEKHCSGNGEFILYYIRHKDKPLSCPIKRVTGFRDESGTSKGQEIEQGWKLCMSHHGML